jgi:predicted amidohydrolase YtcJ
VPGVDGKAPVVLTGNILTMTGGGSGRSRAMLIAEGRIAAVADDPADLPRVPGATVIDTGDRTVLPGFVDPHAHVELSSIAHDMVDCRVPRRRSIADVLDTLSDAVRALEPGEQWLLGQANLFFDKKLAEHRYPTRAELDSVSKDVAIAIRAGGHSSLLNSKAIELIQVGRLQTGQEGFTGAMVIDKEENGEISGLVSEVDKYLPERHGTRAAIKDSIRRGLTALWTQYGVTTIGEMSETLTGLTCIDELIADGEVGARIVAYIMVPTAMPVADGYRWAEHVTLRSAADRLSVRGLKMFCDGGYSSRNAATLQPFIDERAVAAHPRGQINLSRSVLAGIIARTREAGLQLAVHTNGERAQAELAAAVLDAGAGAGSSGGPPVRAEHAANLLTDWSGVAAWRESGLVPVTQPAFLFNFGAYIPEVLGPAVDAGQFRFRSLLHDGWRLAASSDVTVGAEEGQSNPFFGVYCSVARKGFTGKLVGEESEKLNLAEALLMHTQYAAESLGVADDRGTLAPGKAADLIIVDADPFEVPADRLPRIAVDEVLIGGASVYRRRA